MLLAETSIELGSVINAFYVVIAAIALMGFFLGRYTSKVDAVSKRQDKIDGRLDELFRKIDELPGKIVHPCIQRETIARNTQRLDELEEWRNRIESRDALRG